MNEEMSKLICSPILKTGEQAFIMISPALSKVSGIDGKFSTSTCWKDTLDEPSVILDDLTVLLQQYISETLSMVLHLCQGQCHAMPLQHLHMIKENSKTLDKAFLFSRKFKMCYGSKLCPPLLPSCDFLINQGYMSADFSRDLSAPWATGVGRERQCLDNLRKMEAEGLWNVHWNKVCAKGGRVTHKRGAGAGKQEVWAWGSL